MPETYEILSLLTTYLYATFHSPSVTFFRQVVTWQYSRDQKTRQVKESIWIRKQKNCINRDTGAYDMSYVYDHLLVMKESSRNDFPDGDSKEQYKLIVWLTQMQTPVQVLQHD